MKSKKSNKTKAVVSVVIAAGLVLGGYYLYDRNNRQAQAPTTDDLALKDSVSEKSGADDRTDRTGESAVLPAPASSTPSESQEAKTTPKQPEQTEGRYSDGEEGMAPDILVTEISYDGEKFSPASVTVKVGDIVVFRNRSQKDFRPASAPHPAHSDYPEFDAEESIPAGGKWQFQFGKAGSWGFHDHLNSSAKGTVNVTER